MNRKTEAQPVARVPLKIKQSIGYFLAFIALGLSFTALGPTLTELAAQTSSGLGEFSFVFFASSLGYLLGSFSSGRLYDRYPGHHIMAVVLLLTAGALFLVPFIRTLWLLTVILLLSGMFSGALDVGGNTLIVWAHGDHGDVYMNAMHAFFGVGAFLSPVVVAQAASLGGGIRGAFWTLAFLMLPVAFYVLSVKSPSIKVSERQPVNTISTGSRKRFRGNLVVIIAVFFFLYVGAETSYGGWIATYARALDLGNQVTAAYLTSAFWGALTVGRFLSVVLALKGKPEAMLAIDLLGCIAGLILAFWGAGSVTLTWAGTIITGLFMASIFPAAINLAEHRMTITGKITAWFFVGGSLGGMTLPMLIGQLFEKIGPRVTLLAILVNMILACGIFLYMLRASNQ
ncbi:MAG: MFS transporter [Anaerolineae bacterium]|nr:MFS transporter [Anaerolineae bacterium]